VQQLLEEAPRAEICPEVVDLYLDRFERLSAPSHRVLALQACPTECVDSEQGRIFIELLGRSADEAEREGRGQDAVTYLEALLTPRLRAVSGAEAETEAIRARIREGTRRVVLSNWVARFDRKSREEWISSGILDATSEQLQIRVDLERGDCPAGPQPCAAALLQAEARALQQVASLAADATELEELALVAVNGVVGNWHWTESQTGWDGVFEVALSSLFDLVFDFSTQ